MQEARRKDPVPELVSVSWTRWLAQFFSGTNDFSPFFLVAAPTKKTPPKRVPYFFSRVTEQLS